MPASRRLHWLFLGVVQKCLFRIALPAAAALPPAHGMACARALGRLCKRLDLDWRTTGLREHFVTERTRHAYEEILPTLTAKQREDLVRRRFMCALMEELEGHWLAKRRIERFACEFEGLEAIRSAMALGRGMMLLTLHFDAALMGVAKLGLAGLQLNLMTSDVVEDARVDAAVNRYFRNKYAGIAACLNGGRALHVERHLKTFYSALRQGEGVVILGDAYSDKLDKALLIDFLGRRRAFAAGAVRMAEKAGTPMAAFVCLRTATGGYRVVFSPVRWPEAGSHEGNAAQLFAFLGEQIRRHPERWWAADLLPQFIVAEQ